MTTLSLPLQISIALFGAAWFVGVTGWLIQSLEWRSFRKGNAKAAKHGLVLSSRSVTTRIASLDVIDGRGGCRVIDRNTLLFPLDPPQASGPMNPCRLPWFGRSRLQQHRVLIEARVPIGLVMFVGGWVTMALTMTVMLFTVGERHLGTIAATVTAVAVVGYLYTLSRERTAAGRFVRELERQIANAA